MTSASGLQSIEFARVSEYVPASHGVPEDLRRSPLLIPAGTQSCRAWESSPAGSVLSMRYPRGYSMLYETVRTLQAPFQQRPEFQGWHPLADLRRYAVRAEVTPRG
jgi:hypothetical protein